ncbi:hypothetical protein TNCV_4528461 [Trichonephila clavipes]|nr:hypothetical protein TNCV_4528461 [Trichonephila clavipes]
MAWLLLRWIDGATTEARKGCGSFAWPGSSMKEGRIRFGYLPFRTQVLYRPRQNDRFRVMLVLVHIDITPPQSLSLSFSFRPLFCFPEFFLQRCVHFVRTFDAVPLEKPKS